MARPEKTRTAMPMHNPRAGTGDDAGAAVDEDARPGREGRAEQQRSYQRMAEHEADALGDLAAQDEPFGRLCRTGLALDEHQEEGEAEVGERVRDDRQRRRQHLDEESPRPTGAGAMSIPVGQISDTGVSSALDAT
jgi:hypothetical protein